jgi:hypothetical protein
VPRVPLGCRAVIAVGLLALGAGVSGCADIDQQTPAQPSVSARAPSSPTTSASVAATAPTPAIGATPSGTLVVAVGHIDAARADLADRFDFDPATISVERVDAVTWPDGALGCPLEGQSYSPEPVAGYRIVLRVGELQFQYHGAAGSDPALCEFLD